MPAQAARTTHPVRTSTALPARESAREAAATPQQYGAWQSSLQQQVLLLFSFQAPAHMSQSPEVATQIATSAKEQLALLWQQVVGDTSIVPIAPRYPLCFFSPPHRRHTTVEIWVAFTHAAAAEQIRQHILQQRWADIPIYIPQFATAVPAQLHQDGNAIYAFKLQSPNFTDAGTAETIQIINSVSDQLDNLHIIWLGKMAHTGLITSRISASQQQLPDISPPPWDPHPCPGLIGLAVSGIPVLSHSSTSPGVRLTNGEGDVTKLHFKRIPNRAALINQLRHQPVVYPPPPAAPSTARPPPPPPPPRATPVMQQRVPPTPAPGRSPTAPPTTAPIISVIRPARSPTATTPVPIVTTLPAHPVPAPKKQPRAPLRSALSPLPVKPSTQPFPVGTWVSKISLTQPNCKEYGFVLAHVSGRLKGAPRSSLPVMLLRVVWADSQYLDVPERIWADYSTTQGDQDLTQAIKQKVWNKVTYSFRFPSSALGKCIHALTPLHWQQLGMAKPTIEPTDVAHSTPAPIATDTQAPVITATPTPMSTDSTAGIRRSRDQTAPASHKSRKFIRTSSSSDMQLDNNPFHVLQNSAEHTLPATLPDSDYGADWDADSEDADQYDNQMAVAVYEGGPMPNTHSNRRGNRSVPRALP